MEIALISSNSLKIKGKKVTIVIDPQDKIQYPAVILLNQLLNTINIKKTDSLIIFGPGEYEIGGAKISGMRSASGMVYTLVVDGIEVLLGSISSLEILQHKLNEHNIVVAFADVKTNSSFITSLASNTVLFYGEHAQELSASFGKGSSSAMDKYSATLDKLPQEVETIILK